MVSFCKTIYSILYTRELLYVTLMYCLIRKMRQEIQPQGVVHYVMKGSWDKV